MLSTSQAYTRVPAGTCSETFGTIPMSDWRRVYQGDGSIVISRSWETQPMNLSKRSVWIRTIRLPIVMSGYFSGMQRYCWTIRKLLAYGNSDYTDNAFTSPSRTAIDKLRARVGMPRAASDDFLERIRNERRVELAFEDHLFWDTRRWKIAPQTMIFM